MGSGTSKRGNTTEKLQPRDKKMLIKTFEGHTGGINCMDIRENILITGSDDRTARLWDLHTFECKVVLEGHKGYVSCCKLWQRMFALTGSFDKTIRKWNISSGNCVLKLEKHSGVVNRLLIFGSYLFSSSYDSNVVCWDLRSGEVCKTFKGHEKSVLPLTYVEGSDHDAEGGMNLEKNTDCIVTGSMDGTARTWSIKTGTCLRNFRGHKGAILCLAVHRESKILYTGSTDNTIRKWNLLTGRGLKVFKGHEGSVLCLELHHRLLYSASIDSTARCWVAEFGDTTRKYTGHEHMISDMTCYQGIVFTSSGDCAVRAFDAKAGTLKRTFKGHKHPATCLITYEDTVLSGSYDGTVKMWNITSLIKDRLGGSNSNRDSSTRSSLPQHGRRLSNEASENNVVVNNFPHNNDRNRRKPGLDTPVGGKIRNRTPTRNRKPWNGKVLPINDFKNGNNNSNQDLDIANLKDRLQDIFEDEDYWAESSNQSSITNLKEVKKSQVKTSFTPPSGSYMQSISSTRNGDTSGKNRPQSTTSNKPGGGALVKRDSSDLLTKRPRTESCSTNTSSRTGVNSAIALVDEEMQMSRLETLSYTSGYRTAEDNSPSDRNDDFQNDNHVVERSKSRHKSSVSFSPTVATKENRTRSSSRSSRSSKIPTSVESGGRRQMSPRERDKSLKISSTANNSPSMTPSERKMLEQEILDMV